MHLIPILSIIGTVGMLVRSFPANMTVPQAVRFRYEMDCNGDNAMTDGCFQHYGYNCSRHLGHLGYRVYNSVCSQWCDCLVAECIGTPRECGT
ncbi:MAG: hypothetical protein J3R72DRAFT_448514 [Linnemannia gamsii]|nr:MAG: hypothetical protein J3R72DRAFT_448514 [Linnemannia gamsii]